VSGIHNLCSPADGPGPPAQPGFDAVVEWQLPRPAIAPHPDETLIDLVALEAKSPKQHAGGEVESEEAGNGSN